MGRSRLVLRSVLRLGALAALATACTVPDKYLASPDAGDDAPDADIDDVTAPDTTITVSPPALSNDGTPTFEFTSTEPGTFMCSVDGESEVACDSSYTRTVSDGAHTFTARAVDVAGNEDPSPAQDAWSSDTVAPGTSITTAPAAIDNSPTVTFEFIADEVGATFECSLGAAAFAVCTSGQLFGPLADDNYTFRVRAVDPSGNLDSTPAMHTWTLDSSSPDTTIDSGPTNGAVLATAAATFSFSSPDAGGGATFECQLDGGGFAVCASPRTYSSLTQVQHTFQVRVRDASGNPDPSPAQRIWTVDTTPPTTTINSAPTGSVSSTSATITFSSNEATATFECRLEPAPFAVCSSPVNLSSLPQGTRNFYVRAIDAALTADASPAVATWTVDTVAPDTGFASGPPTMDADGNASFDLSSNESPVTYQCATDMGGFAACTDPHAISVADGPHTRWARATDAAGNTDTSYASHQWTADSVAPTVIITSGPTNGALTGPYNTVAWTVDDPSATVTCSVNNGAGFPCSSPYSFHAPEGIVIFKIEARDFANRIGTAERTWQVQCNWGGTGPGTVGQFRFLEPPLNQYASNWLGGVDATFGADSQIALDDPVPMRPGRHATGYRFRPGDFDNVTWNPGISSLPFAVELWFKPGPTTSTQNLFSIASGRIRLGFAQTTGPLDVDLSVATMSGSVVTVTAAPIAAAGWHHVVATYDGSVISLWLDGVVATQNHTVTEPFFFDGVKIGGNLSTGRAFDGSMDEVIVATQRWTASDVLPRYCPGVPAVSSCGMEYIPIAGTSHRYKEGADFVTWSAAVNDCADDVYGYSYLVVPDDDNEVDAVIGMFGGNIWYGIHDRAQANTWLNIVGNDQVYFDWEGGGPGGGINAYCVYGRGDGQFRDWACENQNSYVCECDGVP